MAKRYYVTDDGERYYSKDIEANETFRLSLAEDGSLKKDPVKSTAVPGSAWNLDTVKDDEGILAILKKEAGLS